MSRTLCSSYLNSLRWKVSGRTGAILWGVASRICSRQCTAFMSTSNYGYSCFVSLHVVHPYSSMDTATALRKTRFMLSDRLDFHIIESLSIAFHAFTKRMLTSLSVDERLLPRYMNWSTNFNGHLEWRCLLFCLERINCFISIHVESNVSRCLLQTM